MTTCETLHGASLFHYSQGHCVSVSCVCRQEKLRVMEQRGVIGVAGSLHFEAVCKFVIVVCDFFLFPKSCLNMLGIKAIKTFDHNNAPGKRAERNVQTYMRVRRSVKRRGSGVTWTFLVLNLDDKRCCFPDVVSTQFEIPVGAHDIQFIRTPI